MILTHLVLFSFLGGAGGAEAPPAAIPETFSGGWARAFRDESDTAREARIHAERVRLGILPAEPSQPSQPSQPAEGEAARATKAGCRDSTRLARRGCIEGGAATLLLPDPGLAVDLAGLYAGAWLDQEIKRHFELQDDDDAAVLLLAIAALH